MAFFGASFLFWAFCPPNQPHIPDICALYSPAGEVLRRSTAELREKLELVQEGFDVEVPSRASSQGRELLSEGWRGGSRWTKKAETDIGEGPQRMSVPKARVKPVGNLSVRFGDAISGDNV
jgi:hypothetical protein